MFYVPKKRIFSASSLAAIVIMLSLLTCSCAKKEDVPQAETPEQPTTPPGGVPSANMPDSNPQRQEIAMEEFSVLDKDNQNPMLMQLRFGQSAMTSQEPSKDVKAYPTLKSDQPRYGVVPFGSYLFASAESVSYNFVVDKSKGPEGEYDTLYFDLNCDGDLTNETPLAKLDAAPGGMDEEGKTYFQTIELSVQFSSGDRSDLKLIPILHNYSASYVSMSFATPTARRGKINLDGEERDVILAQGIAINGRYDSPSTTLMINNRQDGLPFLGTLRKFNGVFYQFSATPNGDKFIAQPWSGGLGLFKPGDNNGKIVQGYLVGKETILDLTACDKKDGGWLVPAGDYRPLQLVCETADIRFGLSAEITPPGQTPSMPPVYPIKISEDKPFVVSTGPKPGVKFNSPAANDSFAPGDTVKADAMICDATTGVMLSGIEDKSKPEGGEMTLPDGTKMQQYASLDPQVRIINSEGQTVAEGKMPFG